MNWIFQPLATSSYLVAIANIVALATAAYFSFKAGRFLIRFIKSIYQNRVLEFFRNQKEWSNHVARMCAINTSYFVAYILSRAIIIIAGILVIITNTITCNSIVSALNRVHPASVKGLPIWLEGNTSYNFLSLSSFFLSIVCIAYMNSLGNLSFRVRRVIIEKGERTRN